MVFSTPVFLFLFLPLFFIVYYALPARFKLIWILAASWAFYGFWRLDFLLLMIAVSFFNYYAAFFIHRARETGRGERTAKLLAIASVVVDLSVLGYFKYFNFGLESLNALLAIFNAGPLTGWSVLLPVGISFYVFQAMSYVIDVYRKDAPAAETPVAMFAYLALFPQLIAGPILRYKDLALQLPRPRIDAAMIAFGLRRFCLGFCRKVLVADTVALIANASFGVQNPSGADSWLGVLAYAIQLYFDFSAYSDMAIGLGAMMGFSFMENFDTPYRSLTLTDFWRRWHISLSTWLRDYLYVPLGGNRRGAFRTYVNLFLVMALGGLWHGASWNFALWGCWHGGILALERRFGRDRFPPQRRRPSAAVGFFTSALRFARTQAIVLIGWVLFRSADLGSAFGMLTAMGGRNGWAFSADVSWQYGGFEYFALVAGLIITAIEPRIAAYRYPSLESGGKPVLAFARAAGLAALFAFAIVKLAASGYSPFLYFQF